MLKIVSQAPCRIDLFGGTLDLWPLYLWFQPCATANVAVSIFTETVIEYEPKGNRIELHNSFGDQHESTQLTFPLKPGDLPNPWKLVAHALHFFAGNTQGIFRISTRSDAPVGSGLAASSSQMISLVSAFNKALGSGYTPLQLQSIAKDLESQVLRTPAGEQDYFPALFGGFGALTLGVGGVRHNKFSHMHELFQDQLLLFYTGSAHHSGLTNWDIYSAVINKEAKTNDALSAIARNSQVGMQAIQRSDSAQLLKCIREDWEIRKRFFPNLTTPGTDAAERILQKRGIDCYKVCGAAAGGCMFTFVTKEQRSLVAKELEEAGMTLLKAKLHNDGVLTT